MDNTREEDVKLFMMTNSRFFEPGKLPYIREKLLKMNEDQFLLLPSLNLKDPTRIPL